MVTKEIIGNATLFLGDCREVLPVLPAGTVTLLWTDPPYGHANGVNDLGAARAAGKVCGNGFLAQAPIANDSPEKMREVVDHALLDAVRVLRDDCCCCCCCCCGGGGPRPTFAWLAQRMDTLGLEFFHSVIWDKKNPGLGWRYRRQHEMVMVAHKAGGKLAWSGVVKAIPNLISLSKPAPTDHPNVKPVELPEIFIRAHTAGGDTVLDPFMGSGTTGVASAKLGRNFIGIELEQKYFDIACRRIEDAQRQQRIFA